LSARAGARVHVCGAQDTPASIARLYGLAPLDVVLANAHRQWCPDRDGHMTFAVPLRAGEPIKLPSGLDGTSCACAPCGGPLGLLGLLGQHTVPANTNQRPSPRPAPAGAEQQQRVAQGTAGAMIWSEVFPDSSANFTFQPGQRYAVLASASLNYSVDQIVQYVQGHGFQVTYSWEQGQPTRGQFQVDAWLASLPPDTTSNHRWVYGEGNFTGSAPWTIGQDPPWPLTIYHVAHLMEAVAAPPGSGGGQVLPSGTGCPSIPSRIPWALGGGAVGLGLGWLVGRFL
jgi:hypothetical protein